MSGCIIDNCFFVIFLFVIVDVFNFQTMFFLGPRAVKTDPEEAYDIEAAVVEDLRNPSALDRSLANSTVSSL